jgi:hypothetical protein
VLVTVWLFGLTGILLARGYWGWALLTPEPNEFSRAFCGRLSRSSGRRVSTHGTWSFSETY